MPAVWQTATVVAVHDETARAKTLRLRLGAPTAHRAGQHYVVRLTAPDGYTASRSYSVASPPDGGNELDLTVERLDDGEVSTFLHDVLEVGDELEVRGPIGGLLRVGRNHAGAAARRRLRHRAADGDAAARPRRTGRPARGSCT